MRLRIASLTLLSLALAVIPASAQVLYDNGPINGTIDAWTINFGYVVSDTFTLTSAATVTGFDFGARAFPGDTLLTVDWSITSAEFGGTTYGSGTAPVTQTFISTNQYGYNINKESVAGLDVPLSGGTYWLSLANAVVNDGDPLYWEENSGAGCKSPGCPSLASENSVGTIPSEAFDIVGVSSTTTSSTGTVPEPSSIMLFGPSILGLAGVLRRKLL